VYSNLLIEDHNNKIKIPQNDKTCYIIQRSIKIKNSIEIIIEPYEDLDLYNLFLIIKSYSCNLIYIPHMFITVIKRKDSTFIAHSNHIDRFKKMRYTEFSEWFYNQLNNDWKYLNKDDLYSFIFTYPYNIFDRSKIDCIKPNFPWNEDLLLSGYKDDIRDCQIKKIESLTNANKELIKKNQELLEKIKELTKK